MVTTFLVTGGIRSGKSVWAENYFANEVVHYLTPGYLPNPETDPEWAARVARHQSRRPNTWVTVETVDLAQAISEISQPILIDCLGTWVSRVLDDLQAWQRDSDSWQAEFDLRLGRLTEAIQRATMTGQDLIAVTNEVGWGLIPSTKAGRIFTDLLGRTNQEIAQVVDQVVLLVAGKPLML